MCGKECETLDDAGAGVRQVDQSNFDVQPETEQKPNGYAQNSDTLFETHPQNCQAFPLVQAALGAATTEASGALNCAVSALWWSWTPLEDRLERHRQYRD